MNKPHISYPIIVEGRYDRQRILDIADATCLSTDGFGIFNNKELAATLVALAKSTPLILLTDSDSAGTLIRKRIMQQIPKERIINLYTPQIEGKERRKKQASKEGFLGVEGMSANIIRDLLSPFFSDTPKKPKNTLTKLRFYEDGLSGGEHSTSRRDALAAHFSLPAGMSANALLAALSYIATDEEYEEAVKTVNA